jgi:hypothetical protein
MEGSRGTLCRNRRLFGTLERLRCGWAGQDREGGEGRERAGSPGLFLEELGFLVNRMEFKAPIGVNFTLLATHVLSSPGTHSETWDLAVENQAGIAIRFVYSGDMANDSARVDNALLTGDARAPVPGPIAGAGLPDVLLASGGVLIGRLARTADLSGCDRWLRPIY